MLNKVRQALRRWKVYEKATAHVEKDKLIPIGENFMAKRASSKTAETPVPGATDKDIQQTEGDSGSENDPGPSTTGNKRKARKKLSDEQKVQRGNKRRAETREKRLNTKPREPTWDRARSIYFEGQMSDNPDISQPISAKPRHSLDQTKATMHEIRRIVKEFDADAMKEYPEVFRIAGNMVFEMKDEYAWVLLRKEEGKYLVSLKRLDRLFPEWRMVKALHKAGERPGTKACQARSGPAEGYAEGNPDPAESDIGAADDDDEDNKVSRLLG